MKQGRRFAATALGMLGISVFAARAASVPAIYTAAQATAGATVYSQNCAMCHGAALQGLAAPALVGQSFAAAADNDTVASIFGQIAEQMPATAPGSLTHEQYTDVMAYILSKNGYPAGATALDYNAALGSSVQVVSQVK